MTKEKIIEKFKENAEKFPNHWGEIVWVFCVEDFEEIVDELLAEIEQEKKEIAKKIFNDIFSDVTAGDLGEFCGWGWIYDIDEAKAIAKGYGVEL